MTDRTSGGSAADASFPPAPAEAAPAASNPFDGFRSRSPYDNIRRVFFTAARWHGGSTLARTRSGRAVAVTSSRAASWSIEGAARWVYGCETPQEAEALRRLDAAAKVCGYGSLAEFTRRRGRMFTEAVAIIAEAGV